MPSIKIDPRKLYSPSWGKYPKRGSASIRSFHDFSTEGQSTGGSRLFGREDGDVSPDSVPAQGAAGKPVGMIAGVGVGILVIGLVLGICLSYCFVSCRRKKRTKYMRVAADAPTFHKAKQVTIGSQPKTSTEQAKMPFAVDPTPDKDIEFNFRNLFDMMQRHVRNNYHTCPASASNETLIEALESLKLSEADGIKSDVLVEMAVDPIKRPLALQHVISRFLFSSIDIDSQSSFTLLPEPLIAFMRSVAKSGHSGLSDHETTQAMLQWRITSAYLINPTRSSNPSPPEATFLAQSRALTSALNTFLNHFVHPAQPSRIQQTSDLQDVMREFSKFGHQLISQPCEWRFGGYRPASTSSQGGGASAERIVVCPGLEKVSDERGARFTRPRTVVHARMSSVLVKMDRAVLH